MTIRTDLPSDPTERIDLCANEVAVLRLILQSVVYDIARSPEGLHRFAHIEDEVMSHVDGAAERAAGSPEQEAVRAAQSAYAKSFFEQIARLIPDGERRLAS